MLPIFGCLYVVLSELMNTVPLPSCVDCPVASIFVFGSTRPVPTGTTLVTPLSGDVEFIRFTTVTFVVFSGIVVVFSDVVVLSDVVELLDEIVETEVVRFSSIVEVVNGIVVLFAVLVGIVVFSMEVGSEAVVELSDVDSEVVEVVTFIGMEVVLSMLCWLVGRVVATLVDVVETTVELVALNVARVSVAPWWKIPNSRKNSGRSATRYTNLILLPQRHVF